MKNTPLTTGEIVALNHVMTDYPLQYDIDTIFNMIYIGDEKVTVQENFSNWNTGELRAFVEGIAHDFDRLIEMIRGK
jgi:hypothetical protein